MARFSQVLLIGLGFVCAASPVWADINSANDAYHRGDYPAAVAEYRRLALSGDPVAQYNLGQAYKFGRGVPLDTDQALEWYRRAATHTPPLAEAQDAYGLMLFQSGKRQESLPYLEASAQRGDPRAQYVLGTAYFNGDLVQKDNVRAYALMTRASVSGLAKASEALATMEKYIPAEQQQQGLTLARTMELSAQRQQLAALDPKANGGAPTTRPAIRNEDLPPSTAPGVTYQTPMEQTAPSPQPVRTPRPRPVRVTPPAIAATSAPSFDEGAARPRIANGRGWRVQLGAFGDQGKAQHYGEELLARDKALEPYKFYLVAAGNVTRLQVGTLASKGEAEGLCARLKAHGQACIVVTP